MAADRINRQRNQEVHTVKIKAIFSDLDGTLLNDAKEITPGNRAAIEEALDQGHKFIITTGRPLDSAIEQAQALGLTGTGCYLIAFNGATIYDIGAQKTIFQQDVPMELAEKVWQEALSRGIHVQTYDDTHVLVEPRCDGVEIRNYCKTIHTKYRVIPDFSGVKQAPPKLLLIRYQQDGALEDFRQWLLSWCEGKLNTFYSSPQLLEVVCAGMNKGSALNRLAELLGVEHEDTIAIGDSGNDLAMIVAAGTGVAMVNGVEEVRSAADRITVRDNNHDAIEEVLRDLVL
jgi:Cof subfamily protein (haloacid dehalogenase superfamily)